MQRLLSIEEVAERLQVSVSTLRFLRHEGRFVGATKVGRRLFWYEADLECWLLDQKESA